MIKNNTPKAGFSAMAGMMPMLKPFLVPAIIELGKMLFEETQKAELNGSETSIEWMISFDELQKPVLQMVAFVGNTAVREIKRYTVDNLTELLKNDKSK